MKLYAHSLVNEPIEKWQSLSDHSLRVAQIASQFSIAFNSQQAASLLGLVHDLGKSRSAFQGYLRRQNGIDASDCDNGEHDHSGVGACWLAKEVPGFGKLLSYCVAGHHAGLPDWLGGVNPNGALSLRLKAAEKTLDEADVSSWVRENAALWLGEKIAQPWAGFVSKDASFWIRMLYSALVDADFLDTESFMDKRRHRERAASYSSLMLLADVFFTKLDAKQVAACPTPLNALRVKIRNACEESACEKPGLFSLTVPTGGGKTLSSAAFAFRHALMHGKQRIIYVIPYTSIIEQTASQFSSFLGKDSVLEHHANLDPEEETLHSRLASENWDAPLIVTTAVQFFESLYACKPSKCRKLHNIVDSVIVLDEIQLLPATLLLPITEALHQLTTHYGCTCLFSTATQPHLKEVSGKPTALAGDAIREIIPQSMDLYHDLKRTQIVFPALGSPRKSWDEISRELMQHFQVLCIVNTRRSARELYGYMPAGTIHLSASMCGEHRSRIIAEIKRRLAKGECVRVISTQLIEAGVDVDFPFVYRAMCGLASVVQSAGRCNREGLMEGLGKVIVFNPPEVSPTGDLLWGEEVLEEMLAANRGVLNVDNAQVYPEYYRRFFMRHHDYGTVFGKLLDDPRDGLQFREAAEAFRMIDSRGSQVVVVRYGENEKWISALQNEGPMRDVFRHLQRYAVSIPKQTAERLLETGGLVEIHGVLVQQAKSLYTDELGVDVDWTGLTDMEMII